MTSTEDQIRELGRRVALAEERGDVAALDALTTADFTLVGPLGFVLDKTQWLDRYRSGTLVTHALTWDDVSVRDYGDTAVAVGRHTQRASYDGRPVDGPFRATQIAVRGDAGWLLAGLHLSPLAGAPNVSGAPPNGTPRVELNHTIVRATDKAKSAAFLADILGLPVGAPFGPFLPIELRNGVTLDFITSTDVVSQHYAFLVGEAEFDAAFDRVRHAGVPYFADPGHQRPGELNAMFGGRGFYFADPDGHNLELLTRTANAPT